MNGTRTGGRRANRFQHLEGGEGVEAEYIADRMPPKPLSLAGRTILDPKEGDFIDN